MNLFIFGAGASVGAQHNIRDINPSRAPLMNDLFDDKYTVWAERIGMPPSLLMELRKESNSSESLESYLTSRWEALENEPSRYKTALQKDFGYICLYLWLQLLNVSNTYDENQTYFKLLRKLKRARNEFGIINFNYDTLLDKAYEDLFSPLRSIDEYLTADFVKPHGSVNWLMPKRESDPVIPVNGPIDISSHLKFAASKMFSQSELPTHLLNVFDPKHQHLNSFDLLFGDFSYQYFYPMILMPLTSKQYPYVRDFYSAILDKGGRLIGRSENIYLIGYRAADDIIEKMTSSRLMDARLHVVGTSAESCEKILKDVSSRLYIQQGNIYPNGFNQFVEDLVLK